MAEKFLAEYMRLSVADGDVVSNNRKAESNSIFYQKELIAQYRSCRQLYPGMQVLEYIEM